MVQDAARRALELCLIQLESMIASLGGCPASLVDLQSPVTNGGSTSLVGVRSSVGSASIGMITEK
jgi:hypothetical protein